MAVRERMKRYREVGGAAGLANVQVLVPPEARDLILAVAEEFRRHRRAGNQKEFWRLQDRLALALGIDPEEIQARNSFARFPDSVFELRDLCVNDW